MKNLKVAAIQMCSGVDMERNISNACEQIRKAAAMGAELIFTPEMTSLLVTGHDVLLNATYYETEDPALSRFCDLAKALNVYLQLGSLAIKVDADKCVNRSYVINPKGDIVCHYDKIHLFDVDLSEHESYRESESYKAGDRAVIVDILGVSLGLSICYDLRFPQLFQDLALAGGAIICVPAAFTADTGKAHWEILLRARAIETGCFVVAAGQGGRHENGRQTWGHSMIINPWGEVVAQIADDEPGVVYYDLDIEQVALARRRIPNLNNQREYLQP